jgi:DNA-binding HxlR family transcriptional regulator
VHTSRGSELNIPHVPPAKRHPYDQWSPDARALDLVGDKWTLLIVRDLMSGPRRFVELQRVLPGISTEQLRSRLNRMVADGMLTRKRYREVPPRVDYELTERARELAPVLGELARWGYEWAWGPPRSSESIDVGAIFRLIPGLIGSDSAATGSVELTVDDGRDGGPAVYQVKFSPGQATISEGSDGTADAHVSGRVDAWIGALAPTRERSGLQSAGNQRLVSALLDLLSQGQDSAALGVTAETAGD